MAALSTETAFPAFFWGKPGVAPWQPLQVTPGGRTVAHSVPPVLMTWACATGAMKMTTTANVARIKIRAEEYQLKPLGASAE